MRVRHLSPLDMTGPEGCNVVSCRFGCLSEHVHASMDRVSGADFSEGGSAQACPADRVYQNLELAHIAGVDMTW